MTCNVNILMASCVLLATSCATPSAPVSRTCDGIEVKGDPGMFTLQGASLGDATVGPVEACEEEDSFYARIERAQGTRSLIMGRGDYPGNLAGCSELPADDADPGACPVVQIDAFSNGVAERMKDEGVQIIGAGLGPCGDIGGDLAAWRFSIAVNDWADADATARIISDELRRWDLRDSIGLAVQPIACGIPL